MGETFSKSGAKLVKTITETRTVEYDLPFLREQRERLAKDLAEVDMLIAEAAKLKIEEPKTGEPIKEGPDAK